MEPVPQENPPSQFVQDLYRDQKNIDEQIEAIYSPEERISLLSGIDEVKKSFSIFHKQETDILDEDGKPTGNKRVTIISSRPSQRREKEIGHYYAFIDYESDNPEAVREGLLRLIFGEGAGGYLYTDLDIFCKENEQAVNFQTQNTGGVFGTITGKIDRNEVTDPTDLNETTYGEVYLINGSGVKKTVYDAAFQKSRVQVRKMLEQEPEKKARREAGIKELERQADELEARQKEESIRLGGINDVFNEIREIQDLVLKDPQHRDFVIYLNEAACDFLDVKKIYIDGKTGKFTATQVYDSKKEGSEEKSEFKYTFDWHTPSLDGTPEEIEFADIFESQLLAQDYPFLWKKNALYADQKLTFPIIKLFSWSKTSHITADSFQEDMERKIGKYTSGTSSQSANPLQAEILPAQPQEPTPSPVNPPQPAGEPTK